MDALRATIFMSWLKPRPTNILPLWRADGFAAAGLLAARETAHGNALRAIDCNVGAKAPAHKTAAARLKPCPDEE